MTFHLYQAIIAFISCIIGCLFGLWISRKTIKYALNEKKKAIKANLNYIHEKTRADKLEYELEKIERFQRLTKDFLQDMSALPIKDFNELDLRLNISIDVFPKFVPKNRIEKIRNDQLNHALTYRAQHFFNLPENFNKFLNLITTLK